jgi:hypothetical protein
MRCTCLSVRFTRLTPGVKHDCDYTTRESVFITICVCVCVCVLLLLSFKLNHREFGLCSWPCSHTPFQTFTTLLVKVNESTEEIHCTKKQISEQRWDSLRTSTKSHVTLMRRSGYVGYTLLRDFGQTVRIKTDLSQVWTSPFVIHTTMDLPHSAGQFRWAKQNAWNKRKNDCRVMRRFQLNYLMFIITIFCG